MELISGEKQLLIRLRIIRIVLQFLMLNFTVFFFNKFALIYLKYHTKN